MGGKGKRHIKQSINIDAVIKIIASIVDSPQIKVAHQSCPPWAKMTGPLSPTLLIWQTASVHSSIYIRTLEIYFVRWIRSPDYKTLNGWWSFCIWYCVIPWCWSSLHVYVYKWQFFKRFKNKNLAYSLIRVALKFFKCVSALQSPCGNFNSLLINTTRVINNIYQN